MDLRTDAKKTRVFERDWTMCSNLVPILSSLVNVYLGGTYTILQEERESSLLEGIRYIYIYEL